MTRSISRPNAILLNSYSPYPSDLPAASFIPVKLSGCDNYHMWKMQMECLFASHGIADFDIGRYKLHAGIREGDEYRHFRQSDAVVKGWIFGSLSEETLIYISYFRKHIGANIETEFCAWDLWVKLGHLYDPEVKSDGFLAFREKEPIAEVHQTLHRATLAGDYDEVQSILRTGEATLFDAIANDGNTALHVAASTSKNPKLLQKLLEIIPEDTQLLDMRNSKGRTLLHVAALAGNTEAAEILVTRNTDLLLAKDGFYRTPLAVALSNMDINMFRFLLHRVNPDVEKDAMFSHETGDEPLVLLISFKDFRLAHDLLRRYRTLENNAVLMAIAQNFPCELNILEKYIGTDILGSRVNEVLKSVQKNMAKRCVPICGSWVETILSLFFVGIYGIIMLFVLTLKMLARPFIKNRVPLHDDAMELLLEVCKLIRETKVRREFAKYYTDPVIEATRQNAYEVVEVIVSVFPTAMWRVRQDGHNIIQNAVINRSEKVYSLLHQMSEQKNKYRIIKDSFENNLLHLAARLAPTNKLDLLSGAFLQIGRELQWFKEVERFVSPLTIKEKNIFGETPQMVFTREHKDLLIEGEKWLKATAESYTITAALIATILFAAAITVPGGNNQDTGIPMFTNNPAFTVFAISDAISLYTAITSLLMFLSILTARYAEQDFILKLPTKLIIGLLTLFISTTSMLVASGATLYLVFGQSNQKILITIVVFTCLPIATFVTLQSRLIIDLMSATYGRSIFGKKSDRPFG